MAAKRAGPEAAAAAATTTTMNLAKGVHQRSKRKVNGSDSSPSSIRWDFLKDASTGTPYWGATTTAINPKRFIG